MKDFFDVALLEAQKAFKKGEIPVGAVIVKDNKIIAKSHNNRQKKFNVYGHAEINCIIKAAKKIKDWRLDECDMYVTLEPCDLCKKIIENSRIKNVFYILKQDYQQNNKKNTQYIQTNDCNFEKNNYKLMIKKFFRKLRNKI